MRGGGIVLDRDSEGAQPSDHFGVLAELDLAGALRAVPPQATGVLRPEKPRVDPFPIATYDSDIGFGYGAKLFLLNLLKAGESFGVTKLYTCESCQDWLQSGLEKRWGAAIVRPQQNHSRGGSSKDQNRNDAFIA